MNEEKLHKRVNKFFIKHNYNSMHQTDFSIDILLRFMCAIMDELGVDKEDT